MGLPYYRPFMAKLHYIEFWVTSYNRGGWPVKQFFLNTFAMEQNRLWVLNLIYSAHNGNGTRGGWPLKAIFSQHVWSAKPVFLISYMSAHNGRGVGLPYSRPFMAKLHYIEFWVASYNRACWPLKLFF